MRAVEIAEGIAHRQKLRSLARRLKPIYSDNAPLTLQPLVIRPNEPGTRGVTAILPFAEMCAKRGHQLLAWNRDSREATLVWGCHVLDRIKGDLNDRLAHAHVYGNWVVLEIDFMPPAIVAADDRKAHRHAPLPMAPAPAIPGASTGTGEFAFP